MKDNVFFELPEIIKVMHGLLVKYNPKGATLITGKEIHCITQTTSIEYIRQAIFEYKKVVLIFECDVGLQEFSDKRMTIFILKKDGTILNTSYMPI